MHLPSNAWPTTPAARGTLFFVQAMKSFLELTSFEGFRAYSLDTLGRLREAINVGEDVLAKRVPAAVLQPVFEELAWSIRFDRAAQRIAPRECELVLSTCTKQSASVKDAVDLLRLVLQRIYPNYRTALRDEVSAINDPKRRVALLGSTGYLVSHLLNDGHEREFLLERLQERFLKKPMKKVGAAVVRAFIDRITSETNTYKVVQAVDENLEHFLDGRDGWEVLQMGDLPPFVQAEVATWKGTFSRYAVHTIFAADPFKAAENTESELEGLKAFTLIPNHRLSSEWSSECMVHRPRGNKGEALVQVHPPLQVVSISPAASSFSIRQLVSLFKKMEQSFDVPSKERILRSMVTAQVATKTNQDEARLLSLWSAFEVLMTEPQGDEVRITHFVKYLVPAICIRYHRRVFAAVHKELYRSYKKRFTDILWRKPLRGKGASFTRFAKLLVDPNYATERRDLVALCSDNPLALHRLWRLEKFYGSPAAALETIRDHSNRVRWQTHRIYRVRNSLVHAGKAPEYTDSLVSNALDYLRSCVVSLVRVAARHPRGQADLDLAIAEILLDWELLQRRLAEAPAEFDDELSHFVFGPL